jgi:hypothetical protein
MLSRDDVATPVSFKKLDRTDNIKYRPVSDKYGTASALKEESKVDEEFSFEAGGNPNSSKALNKSKRA